MVNKKHENPDGTTTWVMDEAMVAAVAMISEDYDLSTIPYEEGAFAFPATLGRQDLDRDATCHIMGG